MGMDSRVILVRRGVRGDGGPGGVWGHPSCLTKSLADAGGPGQPMCKLVEGGFVQGMGPSKPSGCGWERGWGWQGCLAITGSGGTIWHRGGGPTALRAAHTGSCGRMAGSLELL